MSLSRAIPAVVFLLPVHAANLGNETVKAWEDYIHGVDAQARVQAGNAFLWADRSPGRAEKVRRGEIVVSPASENSPREVPSGLIHDWIGAAFAPGVTLDRVLSVM